MAVVATVVAIAAASCGGGASGQDIEEASSGLAEFSKSDAARELFARAQDEIGRCMEERGFEYFAPANPPEPGVVTAPSFANWFDVDTRTVDGLVEQIERSSQPVAASPDPEMEYYGRLSEQEKRTYDSLLSADAGGACTLTAREVYGGAFVDGAELLADSSTMISETLTAGDRYRSARANMETCLGAEGLASDPGLTAESLFASDFEGFVLTAIFEAARTMVGRPEAQSMGELLGDLEQLLQRRSELEQVELATRGVLATCNSETGYSEELIEGWGEAAAEVQGSLADELARFQVALDQLVDDGS